MLTFDVCGKFSRHGKRSTQNALVQQDFSISEELPTVPARLFAGTWRLERFLKNSACAACAEDDADREVKTTNVPVLLAQVASQQQAELAARENQVARGTLSILWKLAAFMFGRFAMPCAGSCPNYAGRVCDSDIDVDHGHGLVPQDIDDANGQSAPARVAWDIAAGQFQPTFAPRAERLPPVVEYKRAPTARMFCGGRFIRFIRWRCVGVLAAVAKIHGPIIDPIGPRFEQSLAVDLPFRSFGLSDQFAIFDYNRAMFTSQGCLYPLGGKWHRVAGQLDSNHRQAVRTRLCRTHVRFDLDGR